MPKHERYQQVLLTEEGGVPFLFILIRRWGALLGKLGHGRFASRTVAIASLMCIPFLLLAVRFWQYHLLTAFWTLWLAICDSLIVWFSWRVFDAMIGCHDPVIEMLRLAPEAETSELARWYRRGFRASTQIITCCTGSIVILIAALRLPSPIVERVPVTFASLLVSGFVAGHALYFIIYTALFCRRLVRVSNLSLIWNAPINTPGLILLSRATQLQAQLGIALFFVILVPLTYAYVRVPQSGTRALYLGAMVLPLLCIAVIGLIIQGWLAGPARKAKMVNLRDLSDSIEAVKGDRRIGEVPVEDMKIIQQQLEVYSLLDNTPESFFQSGVVSQYLASMGAACLPLILAFLLK